MIITTCDVGVSEKMKESRTEIERNQPDLTEKLPQLNIASPNVRVNKRIKEVIGTT